MSTLEPPLKTSLAFILPAESIVALTVTAPAPAVTLSLPVPRVTTPPVAIPVNATVLLPASAIASVAPLMLSALLFPEIYMESPDPATFIVSLVATMLAVTLLLTATIWVCPLWSTKAIPARPRSQTSLRDNVCSNPPYKDGHRFVEHALTRVRPGGLVAVFHQANFAHSLDRYRLFTRSEMTIKLSKRPSVPSGGFLEANGVVARKGRQPDLLLVRLEGRQNDTKRRRQQLVDVLAAGFI